MLRRSSLLTAVLAFVCALSFACTSSKLDRVIDALEIAGTLPAALGLPEQDTKRLTLAFGAVTAGLRTFKNNPTEATWKNALAVFEEVQRDGLFKIGDPVKQARITAIVTVISRMLQSITPAPTLAAEGEMIDPVPQFRNLDSKDIEELERLVKRP